MNYKLGSLFDGSGGFPFAGALCGVEPVWAAEVEPYPIAVTKSHFPKMKHLGDISKINGGEIEPVDIITFGSPCQDLSVAGKRAGLKHEANGDEETTRSGLFMEAVRIIKEMRNATYGKYPSFALWENVPGAFSSNKGEDFRIVLEELIKIVEPSAVMPQIPPRGWPYADSYVGDGWSIAYRVFDAQFWGVPQRRRRIHLVLDLRGQGAREVLFEREGVRGYFEKGGTPWQAVAEDAERCLGADDSKGEGIKANTLNTIDRPAVAYGIDRAAYNQGQNAKYDFSVLEEQQPTMLAKGPGATCHSIGLSGEKRVSPTLIARMSSAVGTTQDALIVSDLAHYIVRRLTPTECARLQGFPDRWGDINSFDPNEWMFWEEVRNTYADINGKAVKEYTEKQMKTWYDKLHTDSAEYKMWGNGIALPPALYVLQGIVEAMIKGGNDNVRKS